ncbi:hypothetical protein ABKN59_007804 [Abortiporus biennis]
MPNINFMILALNMNMALERLAVPLLFKGSLSLSATVIFWSRVIRADMHTNVARLSEVYLVNCPQGLFSFEAINHFCRPRYLRRLT